MQLIFFDPAGWERWDVEHRPVIPSGMPVLIDDDLLFEANSRPRGTVPVNQWLRELPAAGARSPHTWQAYARALKAWLEFLDGVGTPVFGTREQLRGALSGYAMHRLAGPLETRLAEASWNLHVGAIAQFYAWAVDAGQTTMVPFTYATVHRLVDGQRTAGLRPARGGTQLREQHHQPVEVDPLVQHRPGRHCR